MTREAHTLPVRRNLAGSPASKPGNKPSRGKDGQTRNLERAPWYPGASSDFKRRNVNASETP